MGQASFDFSGDVVLVTGCARGQGHAHAIGFGRAGASVVGIDGGAHDEWLQYQLAAEAELARTDAELEAMGTPRLLACLDLRDHRAVQRTRDHVRQRFGRIDHVICNAGVNYVNALATTPLEAIDQVIAVNLTANLKLLRELVPLFDPRRGGSVLLISSLVTRRSTPGQAVYAASKGGLEALAHALAVEWGPRSIRVNALLPTLVHTPQSAGLRDASPIDEGLLSDRYPLARFAGLRPEDVTNVAMFLVSTAAHGLTGECIALDGGLSAAG